jgi:hypothetical protein
MSGVSVEVSSRKVTVPYLCPCCCGVADTALAVSFTRITGVRLVRETTRELDFPYCSRCVQHSSWWVAAWRAAGAAMACGALIAVVLGVAAGATAGVGAAVFATGLSLLAGLSLRARARAACSPSCAGAGPALTYHGWADNVQRFSFVSRRYAAEFAAQNERSLVNVTPQLYQLVEQQRVSAPPPVAGKPVDLAFAPTVHAQPAPQAAPLRALTQPATFQPMQPDLKVTPLRALPQPATFQPVQPEPMWPERADRARSLLDNVMRIDHRAVGAGGLVKRSGRASS